MPNKLFGHLYIALELRRLFPTGCHSQVYAEYIRVKYSQPSVFYVDWRPLGPLILFIADPEVAAQPVITTLTQAKNGQVKKIMKQILGNQNIITAEGAQWRALRSLFSPAFQPKHLTSLTDSVVESCLTLCDILREKSQSNELFKLNDTTLRATVEMICGVIFGTAIDCQRTMHPMTRLFLERIHMMPNAFFLWEDFKPLRQLNLAINKGRLDASINSEIDAYLMRRRDGSEKSLDDSCDPRKPFGKDGTRSIVQLTLNEFEKERNIFISDPAEMPPTLRVDIVDSIKAIIFAGYDATAATLCWILYLLHRHPRVQAKLKQELDAVFPSSPEGTAAAIKADHHLVGNLPYATAVIKETLRLFPPASGLRAGAKQLEMLTDPRTGKEFPMWPHCAVWPCAHLIHRNARFFPEPLQFIPERWMRSETPFPDAELFTSKAGKDAFRAFGRGPRACIGSELAMMQMRVVLALTARQFEFVPEYPGEEPDLQYPTPGNVMEEISEQSDYGRGIREKNVKRDRIEGHRMYMQLLMIGKPAGGAPGRMYLRDG
ncbi:cytochrome P450 4V3 [Diaporthe helianthi]|uniref:Cytochrome P450 4V3 n=1 Tax=Diaporthe helianthi TaxID=158607 RepID=A0A2P5I6I6_DIAHE|nr:cytochrome P450 4V3 [Diaporthe helianthi]